MNENLANKVCLITGATSGIGEESAKELNKMGAEIIFVAKDELILSKKIFLSFFILGTNPKKVKLFVGIPEAIREPITDDAPGIE